MFFILTLMVPLTSHRVLLITVRCFLRCLLGRAYLFLLYELTLRPDTLFLCAIRVEELTEAIPHAVGPHANVVGTITPDKTAEPVPLVVSVLPLVDVSRWEYRPPKTLDLAVIVQLAFEEVTVKRCPKVEVQSLFSDKRARIL